MKETISKELRAAIQEADEGAPVRKAGYWWWWRTKEGGEYRQHVRRKVSKPALARGPPTERDAAELVRANAARAAAGGGGAEDEEEKEEIFLDEDARAEGKSFYMTGGVTASPDGSALAWGEDTEGGEKYTLHCVDLRSGKPLLKKPIPSTAGNFVFSSPPKKSDDSSSSSDSSSTACTSTHLFYSTKDALDRPCKVWRHRLGSDSSDDVCVFHEEDDAFYVSVGRTRDGGLILISSGSAITTEVRALKADEPESELVVLLPRIHDVEYDVGCHSAAGRVREGLPFLFSFFILSARERTIKEHSSSFLFALSFLQPLLPKHPTAPRRPEDHSGPQLRAPRPCPRPLSPSLATGPARPRIRTRPRASPPRRQARGLCRLVGLRRPLRTRRGLTESDGLRARPGPQGSALLWAPDRREGGRVR